MDIGGTFFGTVRGFASAAHLGPGFYELVLTNPPADPNNALVLLTLRSGSVPRMLSYGFSGPTTIQVSLFDATGSSADGTFSIVVYDLTP